MNCHPAVERLSAFLAGDLTDRDGGSVREHVARCAACADVADELRRQVDLVASLERPEPPVTLWSSIEGAWERQPEERARNGAAGGGWSWRSLLIGAACGAAAVGMTVLVGRISHPLGGGSWTTVSTPSGDVRGAANTSIRPNSLPDPLPDPLLLEAENELGRAAAAYEQAAARLRLILEREQVRWDPVQRARVAERLASLDEAVAHSRAVAGRDPVDGSGAEMLFAAYQKQIDFLAEAVERGSPSADEGTR